MYCLMASLKANTLQLRASLSLHSTVYPSMMYMSQGLVRMCVYVLLEFVVGNV